MDGKWTVEMPRIAGGRPPLFPGRVAAHSVGPAHLCSVCLCIPHDQVHLNFSAFSTDGDRDPATCIE